MNGSRTGEDDRIAAPVAADWRLPAGRKYGDAGNVSERY